MPSALSAKAHWSAGVPSPATSTRSSVPVRRSWTYSRQSLSNATTVPSPLIFGAVLGPSGPSTRRVVPVMRSCTKTSAAPSVSPGARLSAVLWKAIHRPSAPIVCSRDGPLPGAPSGAAETRTVVPSFRSRRKTSVVPLVSPATRLSASLLNTAQRPSALSEGAEEGPFAWVPSEATETRSVTPVVRSGHGGGAGGRLWSHRAGDGAGAAVTGGPRRASAGQGRPARYAAVPPDSALEAVLREKEQALNARALPGLGPDVAVPGGQPLRAPRRPGRGRLRPGRGQPRLDADAAGEPHTGARLRLPSVRGGGRPLRAQPGWNWSCCPGV